MLGIENRWRHFMDAVAPRPKRVVVTYFSKELRAPSRANFTAPDSGRSSRDPRDCSLRPYPPPPAFHCDAPVCEQPFFAAFLAAPRLFAVS